MRSGVYTSRSAFLLEESMTLRTTQKAIEKAVDAFQEFVETRNDLWESEAPALWKERLCTKNAGLVLHTTIESRFEGLRLKARTYQFILDNPRMAATLFELVLAYDTPAMRAAIPAEKFQLQGVEGSLVFDRSLGRYMTYLQGQWIEVTGESAHLTPNQQNVNYRTSTPELVGVIPSKPSFSAIPSVSSVTWSPKPTSLRIQWVKRGEQRYFRCHLPGPTWDVLRAWPRFERMRMQGIGYSSAEVVETVRYLATGTLFDSLGDSSEFLRLESRIDDWIQELKLQSREQLLYVLSAPDLSEFQVRVQESWIASALSLAQRSLQTTRNERVLGAALTQALLDAGPIRIEGQLSIRRWSRGDLTAENVLEALILVWKAVYVCREMPLCPYEPILAMLQLPELRDRCVGLDLGDPNFVTLYLEEEDYGGGGRQWSPHNVARKP